MSIIDTPAHQARWLDTVRQLVLTLQSLEQDIAAALAQGYMLGPGIETHVVEGTMSFILIICGVVYVVLTMLLVLGLCISARRGDAPLSATPPPRRARVRTTRSPRRAGAVRGHLVQGTPSK